MTTYLDPELIKPLHEVRMPRLLEDLVQDMRDQGWQGRPLLVIERKEDYLAWTGSHRIAAARKAGLESVPCYVVPEQDLIGCGFDAEQGHVFDYERLKILEIVGDETAHYLMSSEGRC